MTMRTRCRAIPGRAEGGFLSESILSTALAKRPDAVDVQWGRIVPEATVLGAIPVHAPLGADDTQKSAAIAWSCACKVTM
mmetsp:Transcript_42532/g.95622  ORF Transcript_42532/g.95622 Transcript_42532/m.95622 type:complete len:80 (+) Transcript_42532:1007-1246(+)